VPYYTTPVYEFMLGTEAGGLAGMENIESDLGIGPGGHNSLIPPFPHDFQWGSVARSSGAGLEVLDGFPWATWHWDFLKVWMYEWLQAFFTSNAQSVEVYFKTKDDEDAYRCFKAVMHRPKATEGARGVGGFFDVTLRFTRLEEASCP